MLLAELSQHICIINAETVLQLVGYDDTEQFHKIFTELGFTYVDDRCDGFCPECEQMLKCEVYKEIKDEWVWIYS